MEIYFQQQISGPVNVKILPMLSTLDISVKFKIYACFERIVDPSLLTTWIVDST